MRKWKLTRKTQSELCASDKAKLYFGKVDNHVAQYFEVNGKKLWEQVKERNLKRGINQERFVRVMYWTVFTVILSRELCEIRHLFDDETSSILCKKWISIVGRKNRELFSSALDTCIRYLIVYDKQELNEVDGLIDYSNLLAITFDNYISPSDKRLEEDFFFQVLDSLEMIDQISSSLTQQTINRM